jgi:hypothetical protein
VDCTALGPDGKVLKIQVTTAETEAWRVLARSSQTSFEGSQAVADVVQAMRDAIERKHLKGHPDIDLLIDATDSPAFVIGRSWTGSDKRTADGPVDRSAKFGSSGQQSVSSGDWTANDPATVDESNLDRCGHVVGKVALFVDHPGEVDGSERTWSSELRQPRGLPRTSTARPANTSRLKTSFT